MKTSPESPLTEEMKEEFSSLTYYEPSRKFRVTAQVERVPNRTVLEIATTDGQFSQYGKFGYASFELDGLSHRLLLLEPIGLPYLFIAFNDLTNGVDTYGGGRYFEVAKPRNSELVLDFNKAYNPYCAYVESFSCPIPPRENLLEVAIEAGEKMPAAP